MKSVLVITTTRCPKCPAFSKAIQKLAGINTEYINENDKHFASLCDKYEATTAPTAILFDDDNTTVLLKTDDVEELKKML